MEAVVATLTDAALRPALALADPTPTPNDTNPTQEPVLPTGPPTAMPEWAATAYQRMLFALSCLWLLGFLSISLYICNCRKIPKKIIGRMEQQSLVSQLNGIDNLPLPIRFSHNQGSRWVNLALFGMTVTGLFNVAGTLLFSGIELGGPNGLFYFYSYFVIFLVLGTYFWPFFISHTLAHQFRARLYGLTYSGLVLGTVFLSSIFNEQSPLFALMLNAPYMFSGSLVFLYFLNTFVLYKGNKRRPPRRRDNFYQLAQHDPALAALVCEVENEMREAEQLVTWERGYVRRLLAGPGRDVDAEDRAEAARMKAEQREAEAIEAAEARGLERVLGPVRRAVNHASEVVSGVLHRAAARLLRGSGFSGGHLATRLLTGIIMQLMISYTTAVFLCFHFADALEDWLESNWSEELEALYVTCTIIAASITSAIVFVQALLSLRNFRTHIARLRRGDYEFVPGGKQHNRFDLNDTIGYTGFQVGYGFVGFLYLFLIAMLLMTLVWAVIYVDAVYEFVIEYLITELLFIPVLSVSVFIYVQKYMTRLFFLNRADGDATGASDGKFYTRRFHAFSHYEYFMTFINAMRGIVSFLFSRLLYPFGFTLLYCTRLDVCVVVQGVEFMDEGHSAYVGMVLADHHHNNPVLVMFVHFLTLSVTERALKSTVATRSVGANISAGGKESSFSINRTEQASPPATKQRGPASSPSAEPLLPAVASDASRHVSFMLSPEDEDAQPLESEDDLLLPPAAGASPSPPAATSSSPPPPPLPPPPAYASEHVLQPLPAAEQEPPSVAAAAEVDDEDTSTVAKWRRASEMTPLTERRRRTLRNRWWLYVTLARVPQLATLRKRTVVVIVSDGESAEHIVISNM